MSHFPCYIFRVWSTYGHFCPRPSGAYSRGAGCIEGLCTPPVSPSGLRERLGGHPAGRTSLPESERRIGFCPRAGSPPARISSAQVPSTEIPSTEIPSRATRLQSLEAVSPENLSGERESLSRRGRPLLQSQFLRSQFLRPRVSFLARRHLALGYVPVA